jgi:UDP-N-acetylmuramoyl-L-alanyl-D-glutamate--2,6-diaminopimelate ligase
VERRLNEILKGINYEVVNGTTDTTVTGIAFDSRDIKEGSLFIAIMGNKTDGHLYINKAIDNGAKVIITQKDIEIIDHITILKTSDTNIVLGKLACNFYDHPSRKLKLIGITGTNGKTTVATLLYHLFTRLGNKCGLISTVKNYIGTEEGKADYTTPDALTMNALLDRMVKEGCSYCFTEVSSHAVHQHRIEGLFFSGGIFTNLTHDHLDYHKTFSEYIKVKKSFFDQLDKNAFALSNVDDPNGLVMLQNTNAKAFTYSLKSLADFKIKVIEISVAGMMLKIHDHEFWTLLTGYYNAYNITAVIATAQLLGIPLLDVLKHLSALKPVKGRFETINLKGITIVVDYAHTPDALANVLKAINHIREEKRKKTNQLITLTGAGGDRDRSKRPVMAKIAADNSSRVILTSDNPRSEDPQSILEEMYAGISEENIMKVIKIIDREEAIKTAVSLADLGDIILIAGKGHEDYQEIKGEKRHFDDMEIAHKYLSLK